MPEEKQQKVKFIPTLLQIEEAAARLPADTEDSSYSVELSLGRKIDFEKVDVYTRDGQKTKKWSYKGRVFINSKFINSGD